MRELYVVLLAIAVGVFAGCKKEGNGLRSSGVLALNAPKELLENHAITPKAADGEQQRLTPREVIEQATELFFFPKYDDNRI